MASEVSICNKALGYLGTQEIQTLEQDSPNARKCKAFYAEVRDELLADHDWNFATRHTALAPIGAAEASAQAFGWLHSYRLPVDCLRVRRLADDAEFVVAEGRKVFTNAADAQAVLTVRVTDTTQFPPLFVEVLARKLAAELAVSVTGSAKLEQSMMTKYLNAFERARSADSSEGVQDPEEANAWLTARLR